jgi:hypothetical protein
MSRVRQLPNKKAETHLRHEPDRDQRQPDRKEQQG